MKKRRPLLEGASVLHIRGRPCGIRTCDQRIKSPSLPLYENSLFFAPQSAFESHFSSLCKLVPARYLRSKIHLFCRPDFVAFPRSDVGFRHRDIGVS